MKEQQNYVYWYRLNTYNNPFTEGYIGVTNDLARRHKEHMRTKTKTHFSNAVQKHGKVNIIREVLFEGSKQEAYQVEEIYRQACNIGWNSAIGGECSLNSLSKQISLYHISNYVILHTFKSITLASKELNLSLGRIQQAYHRKTISYGLDGWAILHVNTHDRTTTLSYSKTRSLALKGLRKNKPSHFKGVTNRWSEKQKKAISIIHKGKIISEEQKKLVKEKNRLNHSSCKPITLIHKDNPSKELVFHSLSEASRQLKIPLSRLKSKVQRTFNKFGRDGWAVKYYNNK